MHFHVASRDRRHGPPAVHRHTSQYDRDDPRRSSYLQLALKNNRFTGEISESTDMSLKMYNTYCRQFQVSPQQNSDLFVHAFDCPAKQFLMDKRNQNDEV